MGDRCALVWLVLALTVCFGVGAELTPAVHGAFRIGVILPVANDFPWSMGKTKPAILYSYETIRNRSLLSNHKLEFEFADSKCSDTFGPLAAISMVRYRPPDLFLGPVCDYAVAPIARFSPHWNIPVITAGALVVAFVDKNQYSLLTRIGGTYAKIGDFLTSVFVTMNWDVAKLVYTNNLGIRKPLGYSTCHFIMESVYVTMSATYSRFQAGSGGVHYMVFDENAPVDDPHYQSEEKILRETSETARIVVLCSSPDSVREIMIRAAQIGFTNGEYVFFNIDLFSSKELMERPWYRANDSDERNALAKKAYESVMTVTLRKPENERYKNFSEQVKQRAAADYGNATYKKDEEVNSFVAAFHDAVLLYAIALNETISEKLNPRNGTEITRRMWNRTFDGITGEVSIDKNGDRNADYSLLDLNPATGKFQIVANYYGSNKTYQPVAGTAIHWPERDGPPPDTPLCGFDHSKCDEGFPVWGYAIVILVALLLTVILVAGILIWQERSRRRIMSEKYWRVCWTDVNVSGSVKGRRPSIISLRGGHEDALSETGTMAGDIKGQLFIQTGFYKGEIVAIKKVSRSIIKQTAKMTTLKEIKRLRDLLNDHLVRFIGVCIDDGHESIITSYCQKGSLMDVLENEEVSLDLLFKISIIQDIVRGMHCIHNSEVRFHGNLKSTNCVVDSRFVVKLTDFGLHFIRCHGSEENLNDYSQWKGKLWSAPEFLRDQKVISPEPRQKGDIYAFAIICQEILYRKGTFWLEDMESIEPQKICERVEATEAPPLRPTLREYVDREFYEEDLLLLIRNCWAEDPLERPDFNKIKTTCNKVYKRAGGETGNIMDSLLKRMEQYATHLEDLVRERTAGYLEQKKRAEDLLYMMLPRSVAEQLMAGRSVEAEEYNSVTIYFSDICGFTDISHRSSPWQVVDLLNSLYKTFDEIIGLVDVYKVETIGDAYMVVSGLPKRNGNHHAREISRMALMLLNAIKPFKITHLPEERLNLRIGIHSGAVCAGVVGTKMPRYCLFGDTVNTASRMESNGEPLKIHVSPMTKEILDTFGTFVTELRGPVAMKGKPVMVTWWLLGEINPEFPDLAPSDMNASELLVKESVC